MRSTNRGTPPLQGSTEGISLTFWRSFAAGGSGNVLRVEDVVIKEQHLLILKENIKQSADSLDLGGCWTHGQDDDPKHTAKEVKKWSRDNDMKYLTSDGSSKEAMESLQQTCEKLQESITETGNECLFVCFCVITDAQVVITRIKCACLKAS